MEQYVAEITSVIRAFSNIYFRNKIGGECCRHFVLQSVCFNQRLNRFQILLFLSSNNFNYLLNGCTNLGPINTRTGNYSAKYLFYRYDDVVAMVLPVTGFRLECAKINRVESDNYPQ